jgi:peptidoglycan/LPS O-acetylase OafA/YrhL
VPVFFVLSGFVRTIGADRYRSRTDFFVARVARVWPAHIAALLFLLWIMWPYSMDYFRHAETVRRLVLNALLLQLWSPDPATHLSYNAPSWSVSCELFFYAAFPIATVFLGHRTLARTALIVAGIFGSIVAIDLLHPGINASWLGFNNPLAGFAHFLVGVAAGIWRKKLPAARAGYVTATAVQAIALGLALAANAFFPAHTGVAAKAPADFISTYAAAPAYAALLLALARYDGMISRALSLRVLVYGGEISYSIYLFHQIIIRWHSG